LEGKNMQLTKMDEQGERRVLVKKQLVGHVRRNLDGTFSASDVRGRSIQNIGYVQAIGWFGSVKWETVICPTGKGKVFGSVPVNNGQRRWSIK
jgi:hypothetical protein